MQRSDILNFLTQYKGLPYQIYLLSATRAVIAMGMMFVYPFMSLFLTIRLGYTTVEAGYIMVLTAIGNMVGSLIGGKLADNFGRKKTYIIFVSTVIFSMLLSGLFCNNKIAIIFIIITYFSVSAIMPVISAMIIDWTNDENRTESFSWLYLASNIGGALGPIIAGLLFSNHTAWIFYSMAIAFTLSLLIVFAYISDNYTPSRCEHNSKQKEKSLLKVVLSKPILLLFIICLAILTICYIELDYMLPLQFNDSLGLDTGTKYNATIWVVNGLTVILLTPIIISFTKKISPLFNTVIACILYALGFGVYAFFSSGIIMFISVIIWTAGEILISTNAGVYIAQQSPVTHKGRCMSLYEFSRGIGKCLGPIIFGYILVSYTYYQAWQFISVTCLIIAIFILLLARHIKSKEL